MLIPIALKMRENRAFTAGKFLTLFLGVLNSKPTSRRALCVLVLTLLFFINMALPRRSASNDPTTLRHTLQLSVDVTIAMTMAALIAKVVLPLPLVAGMLHSLPLVAIMVATPAVVVAPILVATKTTVVATKVVVVATKVVVVATHLVAVATNVVLPNMTLVKMPLAMLLATSAMAAPLTACCPFHRQPSKVNLWFTLLFRSIPNWSASLPTWPSLH
jgi:hypothetical protein